MSATKTEARKAYSMDAAAAMYEVSRSTIDRAIRRGELRAKKIGRQYRISADALRDWFEGLDDA